MFRTKALVVTLISSFVFAAPPRRSTGGVASLDVLVPQGRNDDQFYIVNLGIDGQTLPVYVDTGSADLFVASTHCNSTDPSSGCYLATEFDLTKAPNLVLNATDPFYTIVGDGQVLGYQVLLPVEFGDIIDPSLATPLLYYADTFELQNGSFSGIFGLGLRNVSREYYFFDQLPPFDDLAAKGLLAGPLFSLSFPRLGDPESQIGKLTLGGIEPRIQESWVTYNEVIDTQNYNYENVTYAPQLWTAVLQGIRVNGGEVNVSQGAVSLDGTYLSAIDSGSQRILFRDEEFEAMIALFIGPLIIIPGHDVYFECSIPQVIELKFHDQWFPIDPLDIIIPSDHGVVNGTVMCHAALGTWDRSFADSIIGVPFLRSTYSVFDYQTFDFYSKQPRLGLASNVDIQVAISRYSSLYQNRLL